MNVAQEQLPAFLKTAEKLKIKGLAEGTQGSDTLRINFNMNSVTVKALKVLTL